MASAINTDINMKKLMKIIYQKEKQVEKYRRQLRQKQKLNEKKEQLVSIEQQNSIKQQVYQTQQFINQANSCIKQMEQRILSLQNQVNDQQRKNNELQIEIQNYRQQNRELCLRIQELQINSQILRRGKNQLSQKNIEQCQSVQNLREKIIKLEKMNNYLDKDNRSLRNFINVQEKKLSKNIEKISKHLTKLNNYHKISSINSIRLKSQVQLHPSQPDQIFSQKSIGSNNPIVSHQSKLEKLIEKLIQWQQAILRTEQQLRNKYQKQLAQNSIIGISKLIDQSQICQNQNANNKFMESPSYLQNQEELLQKLEEQCAKSDHYSIQKEKLIQLSQVKQSLKMTKQVNMQLFEELGKKQLQLTELKQKMKSFHNNTTIYNKQNKI